MGPVDHQDVKSKLEDTTHIYIPQLVHGLLHEILTRKKLALTLVIEPISIMHNLPYKLKAACL